MFFKKGKNKIHRPVCDLYFCFLIYLCILAYIHPLYIFVFCKNYIQRYYSYLGLCLHRLTGDTAFTIDAIAIPQDLMHGIS